MENLELLSSWQCKESGRVRASAAEIIAGQAGTKDKQASVIHWGREEARMG